MATQARKSVSAPVALVLLNELIFFPPWAGVGPEGKPGGIGFARNGVVALSQGEVLAVLVRSMLRHLIVAPSHRCCCGKT